MPEKQKETDDHRDSCNAKKDEKRCYLLHHRSKGILIFTHLPFRPEDACNNQCRAEYEERNIDNSIAVIK